MFTNKEEIAIGVKQELTKSMTGFGYAIIQVRGNLLLPHLAYYCALRMVPFSRNYA